MPCYWHASIYERHNCGNHGKLASPPQSSTVITKGSTSLFTFKFIMSMSPGKSAASTKAHTTSDAAALDSTQSFLERERAAMEAEEMGEFVGYDNDEPTTTAAAQTPSSDTASPKHADRSISGGSSPDARQQEDIEDSPAIVAWRVEFERLKAERLAKDEQAKRELAEHAEAELKEMFRVREKEIEERKRRNRETKADESTSWLQKLDGKAIDVEGLKEASRPSCPASERILLSLLPQ